jgi:ABC-2 type transport system ATP-binding protein
LLELSGITVKSGRKTWLDDVSLQAAPGRITGVLVRRGSGRTELARAIMGLLDFEGTISLEGTELGYGDRQNFGYLPGERGGYPDMKVLDQIVFFARLHGMTLGAAEHNAIALLSRLELSDRAYAPLHQLTGAEAARVDVAGALAADPDVVVLDEPFSGLDEESLDLVFSLLRDHAASGVPVIFTTSDAAGAGRVADDLVVLSAGKVVAAGTLAELQAEQAGYRVELSAERQAERAVTRLEGARGITEVAAIGATIQFAAQTAEQASEAVAGLPGLRAFGPHRPGMDEMFGELI